MWITRFQAEYLSPSYTAVDLRLAPVNIFLGQNNSGKSRLLQTLAYLAAFEIMPSRSHNSAPVTEEDGKLTVHQFAKKVQLEHEEELTKSGSPVLPFRYLQVDRTPSPILDTRESNQIAPDNVYQRLTGVQDFLKELHDIPLLRPSLQSEIERLFGMSLRFEYQQYNLNVYAEDTSSTQKFMLNEHGRGLQYFVALFFYLYHPSVQVLFIDEPENSLHPQLQCALIGRIRSIAREQNKQVFLATHSPLFALPGTIDDLAGTFLLQRHPQSKILPLSSFIPTDLEERHRFESYLPNLDAAIAELFFATGAFIVEGQTERQFVQYIATHTGRDLAQRGITVIESNGLGLMPGMVRLVQPILPHWRAVCDGDLFLDSRPSFEGYRQSLGNVLDVQIRRTKSEDIDTRNKAREELWAKGLFVLPETGLEKYYISSVAKTYLSNCKAEVPAQDKGWLLAQEIEFLHDKDASFINSAYSDILAPLDTLIADVDAAAFKPHSLDELMQDILYDDANKIHCETYRQKWNEEQLRKSLSQSRSLNAYDLQFHSFDAYQLHWKGTQGGYFRIRCEGVWYYVERASQPDGDYVGLRKGTVDKE